MAPPPPLDSPPPDAPPISRGWWRRNWWGLLILPVVLTASLFTGMREMYEAFWSSQPRVPVTAEAGGWVGLGGARMRLVELAETGRPPDQPGWPASLPAGVRSWRATLEFAGNSEDLAGCTIELETSGGAIYAADPAELGRIGFAICTPEDNASAATMRRLTVYFLVSASTQPVAVRVTVVTQLPRYARLPSP
jgi:hypothetical protein